MKIKMLSFGAVIATFLISGCALPELPKPNTNNSNKECFKDYQTGKIKCSNEKQRCFQDNLTGRVNCQTIIDNDELIENIKKMK